jgi:molybdenum cofactor synthesis domain-containing protein
VGVLSTGDELSAVDSGPLAKGRIRDSNRPMLLALLQRAGCEPVDLGWAPDDEDAITEVVQRGLGTCDAVVSTGGVSVGDFDYMKAVLDRLGHMSWFQVAIKPSKPFAFGTATVGGRTVPIFGLPGNPVSSHVSFELFTRPALLAMMGHPRPFRPVLDAVADAPMRRRPDGKLHLDRVRVTWRDGGWHAERSGVQVSNVLSAMAHANALALLPDGPGVDAGERVSVLLLEHPDGEGGPLTLGSPSAVDAASHEHCD